MKVKMEKLIEWIKILSQKAYTKYIMISFMFTMFLMENSIFGKGYLQKIIPNFKMLDMNFYNRPEQIVEFINSLGKAGRSGYFNLLIIDLLLIAVLFLFQSTLLTKSLKEVNRLDLAKIVIALPLIRAIADLFETISLMSIIKLLPNTSSIPVYITTIFTPIKWIFMILSLSCLVVLLVMKVSKKLKEKNIELLN